MPPKNYGEEAEYVSTLERTGEGLLSILSDRMRVAQQVVSHEPAAAVVFSFSSCELVEQDADVVTVRDLQTGIFGAGADQAAALADFHAALEEHLDVLERQDALSPGLEEQLQYLRRRLS